MVAMFNTTLAGRSCKLKIAASLLAHPKFVSREPGALTASYHRIFLGCACDAVARQIINQNLELGRKQFAVARVMPFEYRLVR
jgi:hypothetical protein